MRKVFAVHIVCLVVLFLSSCSKKTSFEMIETNISIVNDKEKTGSETIIGGVMDGEEIVPTALYYEILLSFSGNPGKEHPSLKFYIRPNDELIEVCKNEIGFNIYESDEYNNSGLGYGQGYEFNEDASEVLVTFHYKLGVSEKELSKTHRMLPSSERLGNLLASADNATLIVMVGDEEIKSIELLK